MANRFMTSGDPAPRGDLRTEMRLLGSVPTLTDAPAATLKAMLSSGYVVKVRPQWAMLTEQTTPDRAYVLLEGMVDVRREGVDLGPCRPGEILGELGIVRRRLRSATVVTSEAVTVLHLSREAFENLHDEDPYFRHLVGEAVLRKTA
ncbi:MAG: putative transcriptional regulator, Crp/Fnr family [Marmoricola sp.]|nr:putative transcriptional regulator, Crp/Fnr family [Marmoricola sp.]